jgi:hypothetical protein
VRAGQISGWNAETILSPRGLADAIAALARAVRSARADIV